MNTMKLILGNSLKKLKELENNSIDSIVTDPPYELGFMGKKWDNTGIANNVDLWVECLRVLKPGGHLLAFSGTRTYHRMAVAIENAGFEVRDMIEWVYGSGFSKCTVWKEGAKRSSASLNKENDLMVENGWDGWARGGLKPAHEPICITRKPLSEKNVAQNVLKWGTGGINIDESRVEANKNDKFGGGGLNSPVNGFMGNTESTYKKGTGFRDDTHLGRFPANLIHDNSDEVRECFPETKNGGQNNTSKRETWLRQETEPTKFSGDSGNASRFFKSIIYNPKASKAERNKGLPEGEKNIHPTLKPIALMEYLIKMVTPKGGIVLDPFMGSGSTGVAAKKNGYDFIGIDMTPEYIEIAKARINTTETENKLI